MFDEKAVISETFATMLLFILHSKWLLDDDALVKTDLSDFKSEKTRTIQGRINRALHDKDILYQVTYQIFIETIPNRDTDQFDEKAVLTDELGNALLQISNAQGLLLSDDAVRDVTFPNFATGKARSIKGQMGGHSDKCEYRMTYQIFVEAIPEPNKGNSTSSSYLLRIGDTDPISWLI